MESENITLEITYTAKDFRPFLISANRQTLALTFIYIFVVLFIAYVAAAHIATNEISGSFRLAALAYLIAAPLLAVVTNLVAYERIARSKAASRKTVTVEITASGITSTEEHKMARFEWGAYNRAVEYKDKFIVYSGTGGLLLPKRCFTSEQSLQSFKGLLEQGLTGKVEGK